MKLTMTFPALDSLMRKMGAELVLWKSGVAHTDVDAEKLRKGIEVDIGQIDVENGLLTYSGRQVILYIKDTKKDKETLLHNPEKAVRFHVADCDKLNEMRSKGRFDRYVVTNDTSGLFRVDAHDWQTGGVEEVSSALKVCKMCLRRLNYKSYASLNSNQKASVWSGFTLEEFFNEYATKFSSLPKYHDHDLPKQQYSADWSKISASYRQLVGWKCEGCGLDLSTHKDLLHTHHKNGLPSDNAISNLIALCAICHDQQPGHNLHLPPMTNLTLLKLRREQGL